MTSADNKPTMWLQLSASQFYGLVSCLSAVYLIVNDQPWLGGALFILGYLAYVRTGVSQHAAYRSERITSYESWLCLKTAEIYDRRSAGPADSMERDFDVSGLRDQELLFARALMASIHEDHNQLQSIVNDTAPESLDIDGQTFETANAIGRLLVHAASSPYAGDLAVRDWIIEGRSWILRPTSSMVPAGEI